MGLIKRLGMVGAEASDLKTWEVFAGHCMGMMVTPHHNNNGFALRIDERKQRFWISEGPLDDMTFLGWEVDNVAAVNTLAEQLQARGHEVKWGTDKEHSDREVERFFKFKDPSGNPHEIFCGAAIATTPFVSPTLRGKFITGDQGMGHSVLMQRDIHEADEFFRALDFGVSDYISEDGGIVVANLLFMHVNKRHHSIGIAPGAPHIRKRIDHVMIQVDNMDDVGLSFDRCIDSGIRIRETIGRHPNDKMFSFYPHTPSGWSIEMGYEALTVVPGQHETNFFHQMSAWGNRKPDGSTRFEDGSARA